VRPGALRAPGRVSRWGQPIMCRADRLRVGSDCAVRCPSLSAPASPRHELRHTSCDGRDRAENSDDHLRPGSRVELLTSTGPGPPLPVHLAPSGRAQCGRPSTTSMPGDAPCGAPWRSLTNSRPASLTGLLPTEPRTWGLEVSGPPNTLLADLSAWLAGRRESSRGWSTGRRRPLAARSWRTTPRSCAGGSISERSHAIPCHGR
jgi:hypothetical protein